MAGLAVLVSKVAASGGSTILVALTDSDHLLASTDDTNSFGLIASSGTVPGLGFINFQPWLHHHSGFSTIAGVHWCLS